MNLYGLLGYPLSHSFSKKYFDEKFVQENIDNAIFENFSLENISLLEDILKRKELKGFAVTIPYKREVISFLHESIDAVKKMNACNCVKIKDGKLFGYNTDIIGFEKSFIKQLQPHHTKALILGTGGASSAVEFVLQKLNMQYKFVSRSKKENQLLYEDLNELLLNEYTVIVNASPLGTYPKIDECPEIPYQFLTAKHYLFDLVYNPAETRFLRLGKEKGAAIQNGYEMLVLQAEENWKIWNS
jgi:shikimate dehydrogenase